MPRIPILPLVYSALRTRAVLRGQKRIQEVNDQVLMRFFAEEFFEA